MTRFLRNAAQKILADGFTGANSVIILPNRRSELFLKKELKSLAEEDIWLPDFYPIDEFIQKTSGLRKANNIDLSFELFEIHCKIEGSNAKTIDEFLTWAPVIISDFNDIDNSLANPKEIFEQLSAIKAIKAWNPDGSPLTELQLKHLHFFNSMYEYYAEFTSALLNKSIGYQGQINRYLCDKITNLKNGFDWDNYLLIGINALSEAELQIFDFINKNYHTDFIWDVDNFYYSNNDNGNKHHEAGKHIHHIIKRLKLNAPESISSYLTKSEKSIRIYGVPKNVGQAKYIGQELKLNSNLHTESVDEGSNSNTAIVLANEQLLIPLLNSLPSSYKDNEIPYNLTLGYPLKNSQIDHFFNSWVDIHISLNHNKTTINSNEFISLISNPYVKQLLFKNEFATNAIFGNINANNITSISAENLKDLLQKTNADSYSLMRKIINFGYNSNILMILENLSSTLYESSGIIEKQNILFREQTSSLKKIISKLILIVSRYQNIINIHTLKKIGNQIIKQSNINLVGEPLHGIQIMGMLETRTLDFDNVYILSVNEGVLPKTTDIDSFIPIDIRLQHKLPLPSDKSDIYSYHFYRLLQRSKQVTLVYNSDTDKLGSGEKSRFILQIENELCKLNPKIRLSNEIITTDISASIHTEKPIEVEKSDEIINIIKQKFISGYSASLINTYIACPLKFYFSQLLNLNTKTNVGQQIEANTFGTIIHEVLENIYKPTIGQELNPEILKKAFPIVRETITSSFNKYFSLSEIFSGKNLLLFEMANNIVNNFIKWETKNLQRARYKLLYVEKKTSVQITTKDTPIVFKGVIDRVDKIIPNGNIRIIDYKTGSVKHSELIVNNTDDLITNPNFAKAFQVTFYAWLFNKQNENIPTESGIISTRNISKGFIPLVIKEFSNINNYFEIFEESLLDISTEIVNQNIPFVQTQDKQRCTYCDYKSICNK